MLYLHGGGFVSGLDRLHWRYASRLARRLGVRVVLPSYPLTPRHTWVDSLPPLVDLFGELAEKSLDGVVLMGDSAGGGLAVGLAQRLAAADGPAPTALVTFAPWVDLTGRTPGTEEAAADDPWLTLSKLRLYGTWWGGGDPPSPEASPLCGDLGGMPPMLVLCGTRDLLLPQVRELARRARAAGTSVTYVEEPGLLHVYPLLPIPEARRAWRTTRAFLSWRDAAGTGELRDLAALRALGRGRSPLDLMHRDRESENGSSSGRSRPWWPRPAPSASPTSR